jgi:hypothetical protein
MCTAPAIRKQLKSKSLLEDAVPPPQQNAEISASPAEKFQIRLPWELERVA